MYFSEPFPGRRRRCSGQNAVTVRFGLGDWRFPRGHDGQLDVNDLSGQMEKLRVGVVSNFFFKYLKRHAVSNAEHIAREKICPSKILTSSEVNYRVCSTVKHRRLPILFSEANSNIKKYVN